MKENSVFGVAALAAALLLGCAHQTAAPTETERVTSITAVVIEEPPAPSPAPPKAEINLDALLQRSVIHFDFDQDILKPESQERLQELAPLLRSQPNVRIQIAGNCDERGTEEYNLHLGQRRAGVARKYLVDLGVAPGQIDTISYGFERPVDPAHNENAWALNRRDEFTRIPVSADSSPATPAAIGSRQAP